jgi:integrase
MPKITKRTVDRLKPEAQRDVFVWDSETRGYSIRVKPSGIKSFFIQYRNAHGQTRRMVLGKVGTLTPDQARTIARDKLAAVAKGSDPSAERHAARDAITVSDVCDWYLKEARAGRILGRRGRPIKAATLKSDELRINAHVKPLLGKRPAASLTLDDVEKFQADIAIGKTAKAREGRIWGRTPTGGEAIAGRTMAMLRAILEHAARKKIIAANPARGARKLADRKRRARLSLEQVAALGRAMREAEAEGENATGLAVIRFMLLSGFRRSEALGIKRTWLLETGGVDLPDTKSGAQVRPIGHTAMDVLKRQRELHEGEWLFPGLNGHFASEQKVLNRVAERAGLKCSPHMLRHSFGSIAGDLGYSELTIAGLLGHSAGSVTAGYVHLDLALVAAADRVAGVIAAALDGKPAAEVISLGERRQA